MPRFIWACTGKGLGLGLGLALALAGCTTAERGYRPDQLIQVEHPAYTAMLIRPEAVDFGKHNLRFVEGGWLLGLRPTSTGEDVFHRFSVIPGHNARGCPVEFLDPMPLGDDRYLRIGVGIVSRTSPKDPFHDRLRERFPWYSEVERDAAGTTVRFFQFAPRFYFYTRTVIFENASNRILFEDELVNLSASPLGGRAYFHPFFRLPLDVEPWCRIDTAPDFTDPDQPPLPGEGKAFFTTREVPAGQSWFVCGADRPLAALGVDGASEVGFWREKHQDSHVFAVEPFVDIEVPAWETRQWTWAIAVP